MYAPEKIEAVKSDTVGSWIGKYYPGETQINRDGEIEEVVYYAEHRKETAEEAIHDAIAMKNGHILSVDEAKAQFARDGF